MADVADEKSGKPSGAPALHIDTDWKRQAQEEKRKLAEQAAAKAVPPAPDSRAGASIAATASPASAGALAAGTHLGAASAGQPRRRGEAAASFASLVQSLMTQVLFYLGDLGQSEGINLDMAKHQLDTLGMLEEKTKSNLSGDESHLLDAALYETRTRFISVASQFI